MRIIAGAILILASVHAFAHAHLAQFPHQILVRDVLLPTSAILAILGIGVLIWGIVTESRP